MSERETKLSVVGMTCGSCVKRVDSALREVTGVTNVQVLRREREALVGHDPTVVSVEALVAALREAGYDASPAVTEDSVGTARGEPR